MQKHIKHKQSTPIAALKTEMTRKLSALPTSSKETLLLKMHPHRLPTQPIREDPHWNFIESRRENHLNTLFNRRKTVLENISRKNKDIYQRIVNQESHYSIQKMEFRGHRDKNQLIQTLTNGSRMLLTLSRKAMINSKFNSDPINPTEKENNQENILLKHFLKKPENNLEGLDEIGKVKVFQSRLVSHLTSRMLTSNSQEINKPRGYSIGRKRLQDIVLNF